MNQVYRVRCKQLDGFKLNENGRYQRQILRKSIPDSMIRRFQLRAGFRETCDAAIQKTRQFILDFLEKVIDDAANCSSWVDGVYTIYLSSIRRACAIQNVKLYGFDDTCLLDHGGKEEEYHVTELVEGQKFVFSDKIFEDEPEIEPDAYFPRTNFVENYLKSYGPRGDWEEPEEESEWSDFYASDDDDESEWSDEEEEEEESEQVSPEYQRTLYQQNYIKSLDAAQNVVDANLLFNVASPDEEDLPLGQGYYSDCDDDETNIVADWTGVCEKEDAAWQQDPKTGMFVISEQNAMKVLERDIANEIPYVIGRQVFYRLVRSILQDQMANITIMSVAVSALHSVFEQHLHRALTTGSLKAEVLLSIVQQRQVEPHADEEVEEHVLSLEQELFEEQTKVQMKDEQLCQLQVSYQAKELEMKQQIKDMEEMIYQLQEYQEQRHDESVHSNVSPGKRKASYRDIEVEKNQDPATEENTSATGSIMGTLKSGFQMFMSRKKARINPV